MAVTEVARGLDALQRVANVLPHAQPLVSNDQWGSPVRVEPGTVWGADRMFVTSLGYEVYFVAGDKLYSQGTGDFIRDFYLIALGEGARRAAWLIPIAQAEMAFLMAFGATIAGVIGTIAVITVFLAKIAVFYSTHKRDVDLAVQHVRPVLAGLNHFRRTCPKLFALLTKGLGEQLVMSAGEGISLADVAYFLGKLLGGIVKAAEGSTEVVFRLTLKVMAKIALKTLAIATVVRGPGAAAHGAPARAADLIREFQREGITVSQQEAETVATEQCWRNPENLQKLRELATNAQVVTPMLEKLAEALKVESAP